VTAVTLGPEGVKSGAVQVQNRSASGRVGRHSFFPQPEVKERCQRRRSAMKFFQDISMAKEHRDLLG